MTTPSPATRCPFPHQARNEQKTNPHPLHAGPAVVRDAQGTYHVYGFEAARTVLRSEHTKQAGFNAEAIGDVPTLNNDPVLFAEGEQHHEMRRQTARYFTPTAVSGYRRMMERLADDLVDELVRTGTMNLDDLSLRMAVQVAARVVGLTDSALPGMASRIAGFVENDYAAPEHASSLVVRLKTLENQRRVLAFYLLDVRPAIARRRKQPREDLISHLLSRNYSDLEIVTECLTYGTAGMATTREFISAAAWHLLEQPELRLEYLHANERERHAILLEILRLEPVVGELYRRTTAELEVNGQVIPQGSRVALHIYDANADRSTVGEAPLAVCPQRSLPRGVQGQVMSFGDGHHRCPGAFLAIQESDIFLRRLLTLRGLRVVRPPRVSWNDLIKGYELRGFGLEVVR